NPASAEARARTRPGSPVAARAQASRSAARGSSVAMLMRSPGRRGGEAHRVNSMPPQDTGRPARHDPAATRSPVRGLRHAPVAAVARGLSEAVPGARGRTDHAAGHLVAGGAAGPPGTDRGGQRGAPLPG